MSQNPTLVQPINNQPARCPRSGRRARERDKEGERRRRTPYTAQNFHVLLGCWAHTLIENLTPPLQSLPWPITLNASLFRGGVQIRQDPTNAYPANGAEHYTVDFTNLLQDSCFLRVIAFCSERTLLHSIEGRDSYPCLFSGSLDSDTARHAPEIFSRGPSAALGLGNRSLEPRCRVHGTDFDAPGQQARFGEGECERGEERGWRGQGERLSRSSGSGVKTTPTIVNSLDRTAPVDERCGRKSWFGVCLSLFPTPPEWRLTSPPCSPVNISLQI